MSLRFRRWGWIGGMLLAAAWVVPGLAGATEDVLFGPQQYTRTFGWPNQFRETIIVPPTLTAPFRLHLETGDRHGTERVLLAEVRVNGRRVAGLLDFLWEGAALDRLVTLQTRNTLQVTLTSRPGSWLRLTLYGTVPPPTLTALEPPALPITQGGTGTLTATLSKSAPTPIAISLESSARGVASVPTSVTVPAGAVAVPVPVTALAPGTAVITAALNGSSLQSAVTVAPAGPTLTGLRPDPLHVTQGAAGSLTITLSAASAQDTLVALASSDPTVVGLPPAGSVTVPAGQTSQAFAVFGNRVGTATIQASLNGSTAESRVTILQPLPTLVSLLPPVLPLTEGSRGTLAVTLNASQPTDTTVWLTTDRPDLVELPGDQILVPAGSLTIGFPVQGLGRGTAAISATLGGSSAAAAISIQPQPPALESLSCPASLTLGATGLCTVILTATQATATLVSLTASEPGVLAVPSSVAVPAQTLAAPFSITAVGLGSSTLTAGPLHGTSRTAAVEVLPPPPILGGLTPPASSVGVGATVSLTLSLKAAPGEDTAVPIAWSPADLFSGPAQVTVPAGALTVLVPLQGLSPGTALVTAGPLHGSTAESTVTVTQSPPTLQSLTPDPLSLPKGKPGTLTLTIAPTQPQETVARLSSSDPTTAEVPGSITVPAGAASAEIPVIPRQEGQATLTAGPLNGSTQQALVTVTPAELLALTITPPAPVIAMGEAEPFTAAGSYTDGSTQDLTATASWTSSDETIASITAGGIATGHREGEVTLTATVGPLSGTAHLTVTPPVLAQLALLPEAPSLLVGQALQFQAIGTLTDGTNQDLTPRVTWASSNEAVAVVSPLGLATALAPGQSTITATHPEGFTASTTLMVSLLPPTLTRFAPSSGPVGTSVSLTGSNFINVLGVAFNGVTASFTLTGPTALTATVPAGAASGPLAVRTPGGTATSAGSFIVLPTHDVTLSAVPATLPVPAAGQAAVQVGLGGSAEVASLFALAVSGVPAGLTAAFAGTSLTAGQSTLLTLQASGVTPAGSYPLTVTASGLLNGVATTRTAPVTLQVLPGGQTSLTGQVLDEESKPVQGAMVRLGALQVSTDAAGNFLFADPPAGAGQLLLIDGTAASTPARNYPVIPYKVTILAGQANTLGFTPFLHFQKTTGYVDIADGSSPRVVTDPGLPGFQMAIPAGVTITGWDGQPNTRVAIRQVPVDRSPLPPLPADRYGPTLYMYHFGKPGGGVPSAPVPITLPNDLGVPPGTQVELWYYDEAPDGSRPNAWAKYGTGTVSRDGTRIVPDLDPATGRPYGQPRFCCGGVQANMERQRRQEISRNSGGIAPGADGQGPKGGEPVDLATGLFLLEKTDLVLPGRLPLVLSRTYRPDGAAVGPFGPGTSHPYHIYLIVEQDQRTLYLPGGVRIPFALQPDGTFRSGGAPIVRGAVLSGGTAGHTLRFKDGSLWTFGDATLGPAFLLTQRDPNGNTITLSRTGTAGRLEAIIGPDGRGLGLTNDASNRITAVTDPLGRSVQYAYDPGGRLASVTDPAGGLTRYTYDAQGHLLTITDPKGITFLTNEYDSAGRVIRQTQADGGVWTFAYVTTGGVITQTAVTDPRGQVTTTRFNARGFPLSITDALGQTTTFSRDPATHLLLATTDPLGRVTRFHYDDNGNVASITDPLGNVRSFTYEPAFNKVTSSTDPLGNLTTFEYDAQGNLLAVTDPEQNLRPAGARLKTTFTYDQYGQVRTTTDPLGSTTRFEYDAAGNLTAVVDPLGHRTAQTYDPVGRLLTQTDPLGNRTGFSYDPLNRLAQLTDARNGVTAFRYDPNGNLLSVTDPRGSTTTLAYDAMDRLSRRIDPLGQAETFSYDGNGNLVGMTDRKGQNTTVSYDALGRRERVSVADGSTVAFAYDAGGRLVRADDTADPSRPIALWYDALDRVTIEATSLGSVSYEYDPLGRRTAMRVGGLTPMTYSYDEKSQLRSVSRPPLAPSMYRYDAAGRRVGLSLPNGISVTANFDPASRLVSLSYAGSEGLLGELTYQYDAVGNQTALGGSLARLLLPEAVAATHYDAGNRQLSFGDRSLTYDANGNLQTLTEPAGATSLLWDGRNRLIRLSGENKAASFAYDAFGRRVRTLVNGSAAAFVYDGIDLAAEERGGKTSQYVQGPSVDEPLLRVAEGEPVYYLPDALGSTLALTDEAGAARTDYTYGPFGETVAAGAPSTNPLQFTGRENDGTGFYYSRSRYFSPTLGRFIAEDPLGPVSGSVNFYAYAGNNPIAGADPTGNLAPLAAVAVYGGLTVAASAGWGATIAEVAAIVQAGGPARADPAQVANAGKQGAVGGAVTSAVSLASGNPWLGGAAGGLAANLVAQYQNGASTLNPGTFSLSQALTSTLSGAFTGWTIGRLVVPSPAPRGFTAGVGQPTGKTLLRGVRDLHTLDYKIMRVNEVWTRISIVADRGFRQVLRIPANFALGITLAGVSPVQGGRK